MISSFTSVGLTGAWVMYGVVFAVHHAKTARRRRGAQEPESRRAPVAMLGLLIEAVAIYLVFSGEAPATGAGWASVAGAVLAGGIALAYFAVQALGDEWRIKAVVTEDHRLVTSGPYAYVRHPVYLSLFCMMLGSGLLLCSSARLALACVIYAMGTEIRVQSEDRLLRERFGREFEDYRKNVRAWLPPVR